MATEPQRAQQIEKEEEFYELPEAISARNRIWSILSLIFAILSVALCPFYYFALALSVLAVVFAVIMRRSLGFFNRSAVFGLIIGIMGFVFATCSLVVDLTGLYDLIFGR